MSACLPAQQPSTPLHLPTVVRNALSGRAAKAYLHKPLLVDLHTQTGLGGRRDSVGGAAGRALRLAQEHIGVAVVLRTILQPCVCGGRVGGREGGAAGAQEAVCQ
jgi:hypothetical protein